MTRTKQGVPTPAAVRIGDRVQKAVKVDSRFDLSEFGSSTHAKVGQCSSTCLSGFDNYRKLGQDIRRRDHEQSLEDRERMKQLVESTLSATTAHDGMDFLCDQAQLQVNMLVNNNITKGLIGKAKYYLEEARKHAGANDVNEERLLQTAAMVEAIDVLTKVGALKSSFGIQ